MSVPTPLRRVLFPARFGSVLLGVFVIFAAAALTLAVRPQLTRAATQSTINFQARLQSASGAIAPDGYYNVQFKLYSASTGGTAIWTETYAYNGGAPDQRVRVQNGYLSVPLGSLTAFPNTINWDQQLYLTMNVGGSGTTAAYDGEMSPRLGLSAVPYAFRAGQLATNNGAYTSTLTLANPTGGNQNFVVTDQGAAGTYNLLTQNMANAGYIQNGTGVQSGANFNIGGSGTIGGSLTVGGATTITGTLGIANSTAASLNGLTSTLNNTGANNAPIAIAGVLNDTASTNSSTSLKYAGQFTYNKNGTATDSGYENGALFIGANINNGAATNIWNIESRIQVAAGASITNAYDFVADAQYGAGGTVTNRVGLNVKDFNKSAGQTLGSQYGVFIDNLTSGVANYSIYTGNAPSYFGSAVTMQGALTTQGGISNNGAGIGNVGALSGVTSLTASGAISGASLGLSGNANVAGVYQVNGTSGITNSCTTGQLLSGATITGGIVTGGTCSAAGGGSGTLSGIGVIDSQTKSVNGATVNGANIIMQTADANNVGLVSIGAQTFAGAKTFGSGITVGNTTALNINDDSTYGLRITQGTNSEITLGSTNTASYLQTFYTKPLLINAIGNNVGVGVTAANYKLDVGGDINTSGNVRTNGTIRLDNAGNLSNIGTYAGTGNITSTGGVLNIQGAAANTLSGSLTVGATIGNGAVNLSVVGAIQQTGMGTQSTGAANNGKWFKLGSCVLLTQYTSCISSIDIVGGNSGDPFDNARATVAWRVKQQNAMGGAPYVNLTINNVAETITKNDVVSVTTVNTAGNTTVELWGRITTTYEQWYFSPTSVSSPGGGTLTWTPYSAFQTNLPTGAQVAATQGDQVAGTLVLQPAANGVGVFRVLDAAGNQVLALDTTNYILSIAQPAGGPTIRIGNVFGNPSTFAGITLNGSVNGNDYNLLSGNGGNLYINRPAGGDILFRRNNADQMILTDGGRVGIGTSAPNYTLGVNGTIGASGIIYAGVGNTGGNAFLFAAGVEAAWYSTTTGVFSWGFGGSANYFGDRVGVFTDHPQNALSVVGNAAATGNFFGGVGNPDYAELITKSDVSIEAADVVAIDPVNTEHVIKSSKPYDPNVIGGISTNPGFVTNAQDNIADATKAERPNQVPLALSGRIPVKVTNEGGPINPGDYLTSSSTPGYAMKATRAGHVIGKAMAGFDGASGKVLMFIDNTYYNPGAADLTNQVSALQGQVDGFGTALNTVNLSAARLTVTGNATIAGDLTVGGATKLSSLQISGHVELTDTDAPTVKALPAAGKTADGRSDATVQISGNDNAGTITITAGTTPVADLLAAIDFHQEFGSAPRLVLTPMGRDTAVLQVYTDAVTKKGFMIGSVGPPQSGKTYVITYHAL